LLPPELAAEALRPHACRDASAGDSAGAQMGLGWLLSLPQGRGRTPRQRSGRDDLTDPAPSEGWVGVVHTSRLVPVEPVNARLARPMV
jgi:hypothetical protein